MKNSDTETSYTPLGSDSLIPIHLFMCCHVLSIIFMIYAELSHSTLASIVSIIIFCLLNFVITGKPEYRPTIEYSDIVVKYRLKNIMVGIYGLVSILQIITFFMDLNVLNMVILVIVGQQVLQGWARIAGDIEESELVHKSYKEILRYIDKPVISKSEFSINGYRTYPEGSTVIVKGRDYNGGGLGMIVHIKHSRTLREDKLVTLSDAGQLYLLSKIVRRVDFYEQENF